MSNHQLRKHAMAWEDGKAASEALKRIEQHERSDVIAEGKRARRAEADEELKRAVAQVKKEQQDIPQLAAAAVASLHSLCAAVRRHREGPAMATAQNAARRIARMKYEDELQRREDEAKGSPWGVSAYGVGREFGQEYVTMLLREAGLVPAFEGVEQTRENIAVAEAVNIVLGQLRPQLGGLRSRRKPRA